MQLVAQPVAGTGHGILGQNVFGGVFDEVNLMDLGDATGRGRSSRPVYHGMTRLLPCRPALDRHPQPGSVVRGEKTRSGAGFVSSYLGGP